MKGMSTIKHYFLFNKELCKPQHVKQLYTKSFSCITLNITMFSLSIYTTQPLQLTRRF